MTEPDRDQQAVGNIEPLLSVDEVAGLLRISESGVYRLIRREELCCVKVGSRTLFEQPELRAFIATKRKGSTTSTEELRSPRNEAA